jgi:hypothetical protein
MIQKLHNYPTPNNFLDFALQFLILSQLAHLQISYHSSGDLYETKKSTRKTNQTMIFFIEEECAANPPTNEDAKNKQIRPAEKECTIYTFCFCSSRFPLSLDFLHVIFPLLETASSC